MNLITNNLLNKAQVGIILHPNQPPGSLSGPLNSSVTASEGQRTEVVTCFFKQDLRGLDSQIKPICFVSRCQEGKQRRYCRGEHLTVLFSGPEESAWPHLQQWELSWPLTQQPPFPPVPPSVGAAGSASPIRDEGGKCRVLGSDAPGQGRAQAVVPQSLHGHDLTDAAHLGETQQRRRRISVSRFSWTTAQQ